jgi:acylglycerol lipase
MGLCTSLPQQYDDSVMVAPGYEGERVSTETFIEGAEGTSVGPHKLHVVSWLPAAEPRAVLLVCHGLHEHALRYYGLAHALTARGVAVYGCDHYAHGRSDGERGLITDYQVLVQDYIHFAKWVRSEQPGLPMSLLGHSMGTLISTLSINAIGDLKSVVFSAVPAHPGPGAASPQGIKALHPLTNTAFGRSMVGTLARLDPKGPACPIDINGITLDPEERDILLRDPYRYEKSVRNLTAFNVVKMIKDVVAEYPELKMPFLCIHGTADTLARVTGARELFDSVGTPQADRNITIYDGLHHELFHEGPADTEKCIGDVVKYLESTLLQSEAPAPAVEDVSAPAPAPAVDVVVPAVKDVAVSSDAAVVPVSAVDVVTSTSDAVDPADAAVAIVPAATVEDAVAPDDDAVASTSDVDISIVPV